MRDVRTGFRAIAALAGRVLLAGAMWAPVAGAQTTTLSVTASVVNNCTISADPVALDLYDPTDAGSADIDGEGRLTIACTRGAAPAIALGAGVNAAAGVRRMSDGAALLAYELYQDATRTRVWATGDGVLTTSAAPTRAPREFPVYARIPRGQDVPAGMYSDTIVATVNF